MKEATISIIAVLFAVSFLAAAAKDLLLYDKGERHGAWLVVDALFLLWATVEFAYGALSYLLK